MDLPDSGRLCRHHRKAESGWRSGRSGRKHGQRGRNRHRACFGNRTGVDADRRHGALPGTGRFLQRRGSLHGPLPELRRQSGLYAVRSLWRERSGSGLKRSDLSACASGERENRLRLCRLGYPSHQYTLQSHDYGSFRHSPGLSCPVPQLGRVRAVLRVYRGGTALSRPRHHGPDLPTYPSDYGNHSLQLYGLGPVASQHNGGPHHPGPLFRRGLSGSYLRKLRRYRPLHSLRRQRRVRTRSCSGGLYPEADTGTRRNVSL